MSMMHLLLTTKVGFDHRHKCVLTFMEPFNQCLFWVLGEVLVLYDKVMQVVSEVFSTEVPTVAVKDSKEADLRPIPLPVLVLGLQYVQYYADSILIILADNALVGVGSIGLNYAALLV